jgi:Asp-tRNA(Asn)/Glu-tRNA(Gln) amidotransferase A subunit family amidase
MSLPTPLRYLYYLFTKYIRRDNLWAALIRDLREKTVPEQWALVAEREAYRASWHHWWTNDAQIDLLLTVPNATPAVPHGGMKESVSSCGYTFLFNLLDYSSGVLPVTKVDRLKDQLPEGFDLKRLNRVARGAYQHYDADAMHGLPVGVQVVGQRLQEERVLAGMKRVEDALRAFGPGTYDQLPVS